MLRQALFAWAFNPATRGSSTRRPQDWPTPSAGPSAPPCPVAKLEDTATVRLALGAWAKTLTGKAAAGSTQRRKRSVFYNALGYAVGRGHLASNPVDRIQSTPQPSRPEAWRGSRRPRPGSSCSPPPSGR